MEYKQPDDFKFGASFPGNEALTSLELNIKHILEFTAGSKKFLIPKEYKFHDELLPKSENRKQGRITISRLHLKNRFRYLSLTRRIPE